MSRMGAHGDLGELVDRVGRVESFEELGRLVIEHAPALVACDFAAWIRADTDRGLIQATLDDAAPTGLPTTLSYRELELPFFLWYERAHSLEAAKLSDLIPSRWRASLPYNEFYRPMGVLHQAGVYVAEGPGWAIGLALNRGGRTSDFTDSDLRRLDVLGLVLRGAWREVRERVARRILLSQLADSTGAATFDHDLAPLDADRLALELLERSQLALTTESGRENLRRLLLEPSMRRIVRQRCRTRTAPRRSSHHGPRPARRATVRPHSAPGTDPGPHGRGVRLAGDRPTALAQRPNRREAHSQRLPTTRGQLTRRSHACHPSIWTTQHSVTQAGGPELPQAGGPELPQAGEPAP